MENEKVDFMICRVYAGWFDVKFLCQDKEVEISASDAWENDAPRQFLKELSQCYETKEFCKYVIWDEEPGSYVICMESEDNRCMLTVIYTGIDSDEWKEIDLHGDLSFQEISDYVIHRSEMSVLLKKEIDFKYFVETVINAFKEYDDDEKKEKYESNWMEYPKQELDNLIRLFNQAKNI